MAKSTLRIALHGLILESPRVPASRIEAAIRVKFPGTMITPVRNIRQARQMAQESVFDLVVLSLNPLKASHFPLLRALQQHATPMPTVLILNQEDEARLHESIPDLPPSWETIHSETMSNEVLARRVCKAIDNHERHWELNHLQQAFQSSLIQYRNLFDEVPDLIFLCDRSGCLLDANATAVRLFNRPKEKMLLRPIFETFGMDKEDFQRLLDHALTHQGPIEDFEIEFHPHDSPPIYGLTHLIRWQNGSGRPVQFQGVIKDISPHKRLEQQLRQSEDRYKTLYEMARISSSSLRLDEVVGESLALIEHSCEANGAMLLLNHHYEELNFLAATNFPDDLRQKLEQLGSPIIGQGLIGRFAITPGIHTIEHSRVPELHPVIAEWMDRQGSGQLVCSTLGRGNPTLPTAILLLSIPDNSVGLLDEELVGGLSKTLEMGITNCFHYANSQEAETRYRDLWEHAPAFFISILRGGITFEINRTAAQALGYRLQDLIGHSFQKIIHPDDHHLFEWQHHRLLETRAIQDYELRLIKSNGESIIVSIISEPLFDRNGVLIGEKSVLHDITHDKELEARLRDYAENLEKMVQNRTIELTQAMNFLNGILEGSTEYAIVGLDEHGTFLHFNRGAQLLFGYEASQMVGQQTLKALIDFAHSPWEDFPHLVNAVDSQGVLVHETQMITAESRKLTALLTVNRIKAPTANNLTYVAIIRDITEQKELEDLLKLYTENLQQVIEQKSRELDRQHIQIIQSSKLATLGEMATGIAHELNQPLSGIRTRAQLVTKALERNIVNPERIAQGQIEIIQLVDRITRIIHHMRIFARQDQQRFTPFRLTQSIDGALSLLGEQLRIHAVEVEKEIPEEMPFVLGEPLQIEQVILNLLSNARDAVDGRAEQERDQSGASSPYQKQVNVRIYEATAHELCLEVRDNGTGMAEEIRCKIFEPFYTTKPVGRGTGLGLSISYGIVTSHNGRIEVESTPGVGTTFRVFLPIHEHSVDGASTVSQEDVGA